MDALIASAAMPWDLLLLILICGAGCATILLLEGGRSASIALGAAVGSGMGFAVWQTLAWAFGA